MGQIFKSLGDATDFEAKLSKRGVTAEHIERVKSDAVKLNEIAAILKVEIPQFDIIREKISDNVFQLNNYVVNYNQTVSEWISGWTLDNTCGSSDINASNLRNCRGGKTGVQTVKGLYIIRIPYDGQPLGHKSVIKAIREAGFREPADFPELVPFKEHFNELFESLGNGEIVAMGNNSRFKAGVRGDHAMAPSFWLNPERRCFSTTSMSFSFGPGVWLLVWGAERHGGGRGI